MSEILNDACRFGDENGKVAIIELPPMVLGGNDAMAFTSTLQILVAKNVESVIVDLAKVELINSSGLGMLVSGLSSLRKQNISFGLADVPDKVSKLLQMTHLDKVFQIYPNLAEAMKKHTI